MAKPIFIIEAPSDFDPPDDYMSSLKESELGKEYHVVIVQGNTKSFNYIIRSELKEQFKILEMIEQATHEHILYFDIETIAMCTKSVVWALMVRLRLEGMN